MPLLDKTDERAATEKRGKRVTEVAALRWFSGHSVNLPCYTGVAGSRSCSVRWNLQVLHTSFTLRVLHLDLEIDLCGHKNLCHKIVYGINTPLEEFYVCGHLVLWSGISDRCGDWPILGRQFLFSFVATGGRQFWCNRKANWARQDFSYTVKKLRFIMSCKGQVLSHLVTK